MAADINDKFRAVRTGTSRPTVTTVTSTRSAGVTTLSCASLAGWETGTAIDFATYQTDANGAKVDGTQVDWKGIVSGNTLTSITVTSGTDAGNAIGDTVQAMPTAGWADDLAAGIVAEHNQDGTHSDITADSVTVTGEVEATAFTTTGQTTGLLGNVYVYTYDGTDIFINGVDQNNAANTSTWTKPTNLKFVEIWACGGGGGGGGVAATGAGQVAEAAGGGGGATAYSKIAAATLSSTETVTVGAGGTAAASGNNPGGDGGNSSFGSHVVGTGGTGGAGSNATSGSLAAATGAGGTSSGSTGQVIYAGGDGGVGRSISAETMRNNFGGSSYFSGVQNTGSSSGDSAAASGNGIGGGARGARSTASLSAKAGAAGNSGVVIVKEYF